MQWLFSMRKVLDPPGLRTGERCPKRATASHVDVQRFVRWHIALIAETNFSYVTISQPVAPQTGAISSSDLNLDFSSLPTLEPDDAFADSFAFKGSVVN